jgi:long-chain fatty acid transport protein
MKNILLKAGLTILSSSIVFASGWRIPEQSARSVALSGAYVANANGADAAYNNPANMSFNPDIIQAEMSNMYIHLTSINYKDNRNSFYDGNSKKEDFFIPTLFLSSKDYDGIRYGFASSAPGGLSKRWDTPYQKTYAQEFSLRIVELNPSISYKVSSNLSVAGGLRVIYSDGIVKSDGTSVGKPIIRDMEGRTIKFGYNLALAYKPNDLTNLSLTYRSNVDLKEKGGAELYLSGTKVYDGGSSVQVPLPAVLAIAYSYKINNTTVEFEYDKTYWSKYKNLDFEYDSTIPVALQAYFDAPKEKNWKDANAFRVGITHKYSDKLTLMGGFAIDKNPVPESSSSFELPDSNGKLYSLGFDYELESGENIGFGYLFDKKESRTIKNDDGSVDGTFSNASAHLFSVAYRKTF